MKANTTSLSKLILLRVSNRLTQQFSCNRSRRLLAGCGPAATHFSCFAKKSKQKKATQVSPPFGFPIVQVKNGGESETELRNVRLQANTVPQARRMRLEFPATPQTSDSLLPHFCPAQLASLHAVKANTYNFDGRSNFERRRMFGFWLLAFGFCCWF